MSYSGMFDCKSGSGQWMEIKFLPHTLTPRIANAISVLSTNFLMLLQKEGGSKTVFRVPSRDLGNCSDAIKIFLIWAFT